MSASNKPSIVFAHGIWADGSCFQKLIPTLRAEGHEVMAAQYGLDTLKGDVDKGPSQPPPRSRRYPSSEVFSVTEDRREATSAGCAVVPEAAGSKPLRRGNGALRHLIRAYLITKEKCHETAY